MCLCADHNRLHATDVLHAVWYLTSQPVPGFPQLPVDDTAPGLPCTVDTSSKAVEFHTILALLLISVDYFSSCFTAHLGLM